MADTVAALGDEGYAGDLPLVGHQSLRFRYVLNGRYIALRKEVIGHPWGEIRTAGVFPLGKQTKVMLEIFVGAALVAKLNGEESTSVFDQYLWKKVARSMFCNVILRISA
jgi:hypothetical protein